MRTDDVLDGEPRLDGRRIPVLQIAGRTFTDGQPPERVADQLDVSLAEVHVALAYNDENVDEVNELRQHHRRLEDELEDVATGPPETAERQVGWIGSRFWPTSTSTGRT